jgi:hypothetical protein
MTAAGRGWRETTTAAGRRTARNHSCGRKVETETHCCWTRTERNHICGMEKTHCCKTPNGEKPILLVAGRREITAAAAAAAGRRTARIHSAGRGRRSWTERNQYCWSRDGEKLLLLDAGPWEITAADFQTERNYCCLLDERWRGETNTAAGRVTARIQYCCGVGRTARKNCYWLTRGGEKSHLKKQRQSSSILLDKGPVLPQRTRLQNFTSY